LTRVLVIAIAKPILVGIYKDDTLIETISKEGMTSDVLPTIFEKLLEQYNIDEILYVNGPGSFMAIKVSYIFLKTLCILEDINLKATKGFAFNKNSPIKALGKKYFFNDKDDNIIIDFLQEEDIIQEFTLPNTLNMKMFSEDSLPSYNLPAVN